MAHLKANMAGSVWKVLVQVGERVEIGQELLILESMKMEIPVEAGKAGTVKEILVASGDFVNEDDVMIVFED